MCGVDKKHLVKLIILVNWFIFGVGILISVLVILNTIGDSIGSDFLRLRFLHYSFFNRNYAHIIVFVTGLILSQGYLNVLLANGVKKCDERNFLNWFKLTAVSSAVEWYVTGCVCDWYAPSELYYRYPYCLIFVYVFFRVIYPLISYFFIFHVYFYCKLWFRSNDHKTMDSQTEKV